MLKLRTILLGLSLALAGVTTGQAWYTSAAIGVPGNWAFQEWTHYSNGSDAPMQGLSGHLASNGSLAWVQGRADGGNSTPRHGYELDRGRDISVFCGTQHMMSSLQGWYTSSGGVQGLHISCRPPNNSPEYGMLQVLGKQTGTYQSVKCSNFDIAWGIWGVEGPKLQRVGLLCDAWP